MRRAAAAAADDKEAVEGELCKNAELAAVKADALGGALGLGLIGYQLNCYLVTHKIQGSLTGCELARLRENILGAILVAMF